MEAFTQLLGKNGVIFLIGILFFIVSYRNSIRLFKWIEDQTFGTRDYLMQRFELMFWDVNPDKLTVILLSLSVGSGLLVFAAFAIFSKFLAGIILGLIFFFIGWKLPRPIVNYLVAKRVKKYQGQLVDGLTLLANGLRAGLSVPQSLGMVVNELSDPLAQEFNLILQQNKIGVPLEECFENLIKRVPTQDNQMFVTSVNILRETGGNLAETFDTICDVIRERIRLQQKIETYVAQGMTQGLVIFCMPFALGTLYALSDPQSMVPLFTTPLGIIMLVVALGFNLLGGYIILKIVDIKV
ncbi:MAG: type II secretion system F family protein [Bacteriovoracaceae bacterium]|nr:type II secretion system F family protein [Bacteriovoracaceae bacterium]